MWWFKIIQAETHFNIVKFHCLRGILSFWINLITKLRAIFTRGRRSSQKHESWCASKSLCTQKHRKTKEKSDDNFTYMTESLSEQMNQNIKQLSNLNFYTSANVVQNFIYSAEVSWFVLYQRWENKIFIKENFDI